MPVVTILTTHQCRVCSSRFFDEPLARYEHMPARAQFLPSAAAPDDLEGVDLEVRQCTGCGLVQLANDPPPYYRDVIRSASVSAEMKAFRKEQFRRFVTENDLKSKKVVEIGCGRGEYLSLMREEAPESYGIEHSNDSVTWCTREGLRVVQGFIGCSRTDLPHAPYDAFYCLNFMEHLPDPNGFLKGISNNLAPGAVGLVEVPNFDMIQRKKIFYEFMRDHLYYFTQETLKTTLRINGFEILDCREVWHDYIISAVVRRREPAPLSSLVEQERKIKCDIEKFFELIGSTRVAVWGAGHQALALLALMGLSKRIRYVIDSAPFKQGKVTPATHVPIVSPAALASDPVDAVMVMAGSYSDEVVATLRKSHPAMRVSVLRDNGMEYVQNSRE